MAFSPSRRLRRRVHPQRQLFSGWGGLSLPARPWAVLGADGQPIYLATDRIRADQAGNLYTEGGGYVGRLGLYAFADNGLLEEK